MRKSVFYIFFGLILLSLLSPIWVFSHQLFPYITSKAFYFRICIELAIPFFVYLIFIDKSLRPKLKNPLNIAVLVFLAISLLSAIFGVNSGRSLWGNFERMGGVYYLAHLVLFYFYLQVLAGAGSKYLKFFLQSFIWVAVLVTLNGISGWLGGPTVVQDPSLPARVSSTFGNPIFFASYLIIPMFLAVYFALQEEKKGIKIFYLVLALVQLLGIYSSGTRGAVVGIIVGLFVSSVLYLSLTKNLKLRKLGLIGVGALVILVAGLVLNAEKLPQGSTLYRLVKLRDSNTEARLIQWKVALTGFKDKPVLGVGPENYYVISNKYYNPEIYKYDGSWFDKPHNFILEVLTTTGVAGFLAYLSLFALSIYGLWKAFKSNLFGLAEFCVFVSAHITYQVQNLTVFDTVSASIAFFALLGLSAYVWVGSEQLVKEDVRKASSVNFGTTWLAVCILLVLYLVYISNIMSMQVSKRINFGNAYTTINPEKAADFFNSALAVPYNLDPTETANKYTDFISSVLSSSSLKVSDEFKILNLKKASDAQRKVAEKTKNEALSWMRVAVNDLNLAVVHNTSLDLSLESIKKAVSLAPKRVELLQLYIQYYNYKKDWVSATKVAEEIYRLNPYSPKLQWQVAISYFLVDRLEDAVKMADEALAKGYKNTELPQFAWYIQYYQEKKDFAKVIPLLEQAVELQPNDIGLYFELAKAYAGIGDTDHAEALARQIAESDPSQKEIMQNFIESLK